MLRPRRPVTRTARDVSLVMVACVGGEGIQKAKEIIVESSHERRFIRRP